MTLPTPRAALDGIPVYRAGRPATDDALKLSSNENPFPPLPGVIERATSRLSHINRYPDAGCTLLYDALAKRFGLPAERFAAGTGSVAVLFSLLQALCSDGDEVVYAWRSFEAYPIAVEITGAKSVQVPLAADATHDLDAMLAAITERTKLVLVCTPNNPTGPVVQEADLRAFIERCPPHVVVVVDEAYVEFVRDPGAAHGLSSGKGNVVVLRTFSKAYGLAGLRVGYAIAPPPLAEAIRKATAPFSVSDVAQEAAVASLEAEDELLERVEQVVAERSRVVESLVSQGWDIPAAEGNFVWLPLGDGALEFAEACFASGLSVRPFAGDGVRVTIGDPHANDLFVQVASRWRSQRSDDDAFA